MCGIIGYVGKSKAEPLLLAGLKKLEYRGYDSSGIALMNGDKIVVVKEKGKVSNLERLIKTKTLPDVNIGLAHTRWATHGIPNRINAHPHGDCSGKIVVVHNGIIENFSELRYSLEKYGHKIRSKTDTELIAHLLEYYTEKTGSFSKAFHKTLKKLVGAYGLVAMSTTDPQTLYCACLGSPLVLGVGKDGNFVASDMPTLLSFTRRIINLEDNQVAVLKGEDYQIMTIDRKPVVKKIETINDDIAVVKKSGYKYFMLKEIMEQPDSLAYTMRGRVKNTTLRLGGIEEYLPRILESKRVILCACGTSWHACLVAEYLIEEFLGWPVEVEYASEFRYRKSPIDTNTLFIVVSQSGETADTLAALKKAKSKGALTLGICNVVGTQIPRLTDAGVYLHAGPEIGVASTKAFTSQVLVFILFTILLMKQKGEKVPRKYLQEISNIPELVAKILTQTKDIKRIARLYKHSSNFLYLGRGVNFPVALEGALKLKEISYIHAEGYPAAEMKHGAIALIDKQMPVVVIATKDGIYDKIISNIQEVKTRNGKIIAIATEGDEEIKKYAKHVIYIPKTLSFLYPLLTVIPLQLLAYHIADAKKINVDQPRNLAKAVTVE